MPCTGRHSSDGGVCTVLAGGQVRSKLRGGGGGASVCLPELILALLTISAGGRRGAALVVVGGAQQRCKRGLSITSHLSQ